MSSLLRRWLPDSLPGWQIDLRIGLVCILVSLALAAPPLWLYRDPQLSGRLVDVMAQAVDPLRRDLQEPILYHRIVVPAFNHLVGLRGLAVAVPGLAASALCLVLTARILRTAVGSALYAFQCCLALAMTLFIVEGTSFWMAPDSVSHLFVLLAALPGATGAFLALAAPIALLNDERALLSLAYLPLLAALPAAVSPKPAGATPWRRASVTAMGLGIGIGLWLLGRFALQTGWIGAGFSRPEHYRAVGIALGAIRPLDGWWVWLANVWASFKWVWIAPLLAAGLAASAAARPGRAVLPLPPGTAVVLLATGLTGAILVLSLFNGDVWRSVSFAFPAMILAQIHLHRHSPERASRLASGIALAMLVTPVLYFGSNLVLQVFPPLPLVLVRTFLPLQHPLNALIRALI